MTQQGDKVKAREMEPAPCMACGKTNLRPVLAEDAKLALACQDCNYVLIGLNSENAQWAHYRGVAKAT